MDRMSTGSRESTRSTQSEWVGDRKKKAGLIGKLRKLTRGLSAEREFGSGSDISVTSMGRGGTRVAREGSAEANKPFDKYFQEGGSGSRRSSRRK